jgi:hypothetical protein
MTSPTISIDSNNFHCDQMINLDPIDITVHNDCYNCKKYIKFFKHGTYTKNYKLYPEIIYVIEPNTSKSFPKELFQNHVAFIDGFLDSPIIREIIPLSNPPFL